VVRSWNREHCLTAQFFVIHQRLMFSAQQNLPGTIFKTHRPIVWLGHVASPGIGMEVVNQVAAADDQYTFITKFGKSTSDFEMKYRRLCFIDAELYHRNIRLRIHMTKYRPRPVIQPQR
jgi:hypothetical protein